MKKASTIFLIVILSVIVFYFTFSPNKTIQPNTYYKVYLDDKLMGTIKSKQELENYINNQGKKIASLVNDYSKKVDIIDNSKSILDSFNNNDTENLNLEQKANYIIKNQKNLNISDIKASSDENKIIIKINFNNGKIYYENWKLNGNILSCALFPHNNHFTFLLLLLI